MKAASGDDRMADGKFASRFLQVTAKRQDAKVTIAIYDNFRELLFACNIPHTGNGPRVHDFRHTFAVHTLEKQLSDGYDPMVIVPRLAAYLGHKSYRETCWYIHLTVASFPELSQKLDRAFVGIIPVGGETDEEN